MNFLKRINGLTVFIALLTFILGWQVGHHELTSPFGNYQTSATITNKEVPKNVNIDFKLFWDTWDLVSRTYIDKSAIDPQKMFYGAIQGMVAAIGDPYTVFLPPDSQKAMQEQIGGSFDGVGIELGFNADKRLVVIAPLDGTPADKAGIKAGDIIVKIADKDTTNVTLPDAVKLIKGPKGTSITLTIFRDGEKTTRDVKLTRDTIVVKSVTVTYKNTKSGKKIAVIKLSQFGERTNDEWDAAVSDVLASGSQGIVLDMRNNPGGLLESAVYIGSEFLDGGNVVLSEDAQKQRTPYPVNRQGKLLKLPMMVLVNKGSASAAEIVSGALQDRGRAKLVGEKTFGKGTVQETQDLPGGTGIHITTHRWLTPNGRWTNATKGFDPDYPVALDPNDATKDAQLDKALDLLN